MDTLLQDLRYALRGLRRSPGFTLAAVATLAIGIGANATVFSAANAFLFRPADARDPGRLIRIHWGHHSPPSLGHYRYVREHNRSFSGVVGVRDAAVALGTERGNERVYAALVSGDYFSTLGIPAAAGALFGAQHDVAAGAHPVVVLSHAFWMRRFGGDRSLIGRTVRLGGRPYTVLGVARAGFHGPSPGFAPDLWAPLAEAGPLLGWAQGEEGRSVYTYARLRPGVSRAQAQANLDQMARELTRLEPGRDLPVQLRADDARGIHRELRGMAMASSAMLLAVVAGVLLIACANLANLLLARAVARRREIGIRLALGAGRGRLMRQLLTESLLLALAGGAVGLGLAYLGARVLEGFIPQVEQLVVKLTPDARVLAFTLGVSVLAAVLCGLAPARRATSPDLMEALRPSGTGQTRMRGRLVLAQAALCTVLLGGALLFLRSLGNAGAVDPGFQAERVLDLRVDVGLLNYDRPRGDDYFRRLQEGAAALPGVESVAMGAVVPLGGSNMETRYSLAGEDQNSRSTYFNVVTPGYFRTLGIPLAAGRELTAGETDGVVVNRAFAERTWPGESALGRQIQYDGRARTVVGVSRDANYVSLGEAARPTLYLPHASDYADEMTLHVRTAGPPAGLRQALGEMAAALDPALPLAAPTTLHEDTRISLLAPRLGAALLAAFGGLALLLAAVGIYGVVSYTVAQRTRELGIRSALGSSRAALVRLVVGGGLRPVLIGTGVGLLLAMALARAVRAMLFGVSPLDPALLAGAPLVLVVTAVLASLLPARRATRVDPLLALKSE